MARWGSDPQVKEWMKSHPKEVGRVEKLYSVLKDMSSEELEDLALVLMVNVERRRAQFRDNLITDIVKAAPERALEVISGQGVLSSDKKEEAK